MKRQKQGFSLVELMVVCSIISILTGGVIVHYSGFINSSSDVLLNQERQCLRGALDDYARRFGRYPDAPEDLVRCGLVTPAPRRADESRLSRDGEVERWKERWSWVRNEAEPRGIIDVIPLERSHT